MTSVREVLPSIAKVAAEVMSELSDGVALDPPALVAPPNPEMGDCGFAVFPYFKRLGFNNPKQFADTLVEALHERVQDHDLVESVSATGPYVNFRIHLPGLANVVVNDIAEQGESYGQGAVNASRPIMIEFSSPNTNKPQHLGHVRNNLLGETTASILEHYGHKVIRANLINDRGIHICKSMLAYQRFGDGETPESTNTKGDLFVGNYYVRFDAELRAEYDAWLGTAEAQEACETWRQDRAGKKAIGSWQRKQKKALKLPRDAPDPQPSDDEVAALFKSSYKDTYFNTASELGAATRAMLQAWEAGDDEVRALWETMNSWVKAGFHQTYERLGIRFDRIDLESETYLLGKDVVQQGLDAGTFREADNGAIVFDLERIGLKGEKALLRSDGTSLYTTQDMGTALVRFDDNDLERLIYVVGDEQNHHFRVLFGIMTTLRPDLDGRLHHLSYGMVNLPHGRMKSREGTVVDADDLMDEMENLGRQAVQERDTEGALSDDEVASRGRAIGLGALKYYLLNFNPATTMTFDPEESIRFEGQTGPYCMYAFARTSSILRTAEFAAGDVDTSASAELKTDLERALVQQLAELPQAVEWAAQQNDPSKLADYGFRLSKAIASLVNDDDHHVLRSPEPRRTALLQLVNAANHTVGIVLRLLGIERLPVM